MSLFGQLVVRAREADKAMLKNEVAYSLLALLLHVKDRDGTVAMASPPPRTLRAQPAPPLAHRGGFALKRKGPPSVQEGGGEPSGCGLALQGPIRLATVGKGMLARPSGAFPAPFWFQREQAGCFLGVRWGLQGPLGLLLPPAVEAPPGGR